MTAPDHIPTPDEDAAMIRELWEETTMTECQQEPAVLARQKARDQKLWDEFVTWCSRNGMTWGAGIRALRKETQDAVRATNALRHRVEEAIR